MYDNKHTPCTLKKERIFQLVKKHFKRAGKLNFIFIAFSLTVAGKVQWFYWTLLGGGK
jgi:hypothetical protein